VKSSSSVVGTASSLRVEHTHVPRGRCDRSEMVLLVVDASCGVEAGST
jgi:hypothetical protein